MNLITDAEIEVLEKYVDVMEFNYHERPQVESATMRALLARLRSAEEALKGAIEFIECDPLCECCVKKAREHFTRIKGDT